MHNKNYNRTCVTSKDLYNASFDWFSIHHTSLTGQNFHVQNKNTENKRASVLFTWLPDKVELIGLLVQEKKFNIDFQDGGHLGFPIRTILATFDLQWSFESIALLVQKKKVQNRFSTGLLSDHLGCPIRMILAIFVLQVTLILTVKFQVNGPICSWEEVKNRFSTWQLWQPACISDRNDFSYF